MASCFINEFLQQFPFRVITLGDGGVHFQKQLARGGGGGGVLGGTILWRQKSKSLLGVSAWMLKKPVLPESSVAWSYQPKCLLGLKEPSLGKSLFPCLVPCHMGGKKKKQKKKLLLWLLSKYLVIVLLSRCLVRAALSEFVTAKILGQELQSRHPGTFRGLWFGTGLHVSPQPVHSNHPH